MIDFKQFEIFFKGLALGEHKYSFVLDGSFFERFDYSEISQSNISVEMELLKEKRMLTLAFNIQGTVRLICDRCLDEYDQLVTQQQTLLVKFGLNSEEMAEDLLVLAEDEHMLDVSQLIYEYIILSMPMRRVHPDNSCDSSVTEHIQSEKTEIEVKQDEEIDPRWSALTKLKNTNN